MKRRRQAIRVAGGRDDRFAQDALSHLGSLYGTALRLTRRAPDAEDLVQETYLKAFRFAGTFERGTNLKAWLFTILHNTFRNVLRDGSRDPVDVDSDIVDRTSASPQTAATPEDLLMRSTLDAELQEAIDALPLVYREAVWMRDVEELTYQEIAHALEVPLGTVMSRISRGRRLLHDYLVHGSALSTRAAQPRAVENTGQG